MDYSNDHVERYQILSGNQSKLCLNSCFFSCSPHILPLISLLDPCKPLLQEWHLFALPVVSFPNVWRLFWLIFLLWFFTWSLLCNRPVVSDFFVVSWFWYQISYSCVQPVRCLFRFLLLLPWNFFCNMPVSKWDCCKPVILYLIISSRFQIVRFREIWIKFRNLYRHAMHETNFLFLIHSYPFCQVFSKICFWHL